MTQDRHGPRHKQTSYATDVLDAVGSPKNAGRTKRRIRPFLGFQEAETRQPDENMSSTAFHSTLAVKELLVIVEFPEISRVPKSNTSFRVFPRNRYFSAEDTDASSSSVPRARPRYYPLYVERRHLYGNIDKVPAGSTDGCARRRGKDWP